MKHYPLFKVHVPEHALMNVKQVFDSGFINEGTQVTQLTHELSSYLNARHLILTNSCTSAITLALHLAGATRDTEVISTPMTCVATNTPVVNAGAKLVWADIDPKTGMIDPQSVSKKITKRTKAVIAVAWAGTPPELEALGYVCKQRGVKLILDAAHAFGAKQHSLDIHAYADYTTYSFQAIKHFTTGDGGALVCASNADHERAKALKWFGLDRDKTKDAQGNWKGQQWDADIVEAGYKFNMNNVAAAIGLAQMQDIEHILDTHRSNAEIYEALLPQTDAITSLIVPPGSISSHWTYCVKVDPRYSKLTRDELLKALNEEGIMAGLVHVPNDAYTAFASSTDKLPGVREFAAHQFSLPCGWWLTKSNINHISKRVVELTRK